MTKVNLAALRLLLSPIGECPMIGPEAGTFNQDGISCLKSPHGSIRYVHATGGRITSALQVLVSTNAAVATNAYTDNGFLRRGQARQLIMRAMQDFQALEFSQERSDDGAALVKSIKSAIGNSGHFDFNSPSQTDHGAEVTIERPSAG